MRRVYYCYCMLMLIVSVVTVVNSTSTHARRLVDNLRAERHDRPSASAHLSPFPSRGRSKRHVVEGSRSDLARSYARSEPPLVDGKPTEVFVGFHVESMGSLDCTNMEFHVDLYFRVSWTDRRLASNGTDDGDDKIFVINSAEALEDVWLPDLYFPNSRSAEFHNVTVPNFAVWVESDGTVAYSSRISMDVSCNLDLADYPMDTQDCALRIASYAHTAADMPVAWFSDTPIERTADIMLPEFELENIHAGQCSVDHRTYNYAKTEKGSKTAAFACLSANFHFRRQVGYHVVQTYIPTAAIVAISWVSFWIDPGAVPARVSLSFTTLLTLTTMVRFPARSTRLQSAGVRFSLPPVAYAKAVDYWMGMCMLFVFIALIEFALVNSFMRRAAKCDKLADRILYKRMTTTSMPQAPSNRRHSNSRRTMTRNAHKVVAATMSLIDEDDVDEVPTATVLESRPSIEHTPESPMTHTAIPSTTVHNSLSILSQMMVPRLTAEPMTEGYSAAIMTTVGNEYAKKALFIDQVSRILCPIAFGLWATFYWLIYSHLVTWEHVAIWNYWNF